MKLLLTGAFNYSEKQLKILENIVSDIVFLKDETITLKEQKHDFKNEEIQGIICNSFFLHNNIKDFKNLRYIQLLSAGMDRVPLDYVKENDIRIYNAQGIYSKPIAEWVILKILEIYKNSLFFHNNQRNKLWIKNRNILELTDKKVCILGFGNIGEAIARLLCAFGALGIGVDVIKKKSDFLHEFYFMKDGVILINISRGKVIHEQDFLEAIQSKKIGAAALDVFAVEPLPSDSLLWDFDNVSVTPHNSYVSDKVSERLFSLIIENLEKNISTENLGSYVNEKSR
jgi:phosphoglycerate dehydrogenase-like enzyme